MASKLGRKLCATALLMFATGWVLNGCGNTSADTASRSHVPAPVTENGMTLLWGEDVKTKALSMIAGSQHTCYLDMYELSDEDIIQALKDAHHRGVDVRIVVDATEKHSQQTAVPELQQAGVAIHSLAIHRGISHIKMLLTDGQASGALIGGMNYGAGSWDNNDASVYMTQPNPSFTAVYHWDWSRAANHPVAAPSAVQPLLNERTTEQRVVSAITQAQTSVYMEAFNLSDHGVLNALLAAARRGTLVEVLLDPGQTQNNSAADKLRQAGATVRFYHPYQSEWMHAKIVDVDHGKTFLIGSANFSHQAYTYNHEGTIELHNVPGFDKSLESNLSLQIRRGTDYPEQKRYSTRGGTTTSEDTQQ